MQHRLTGIAAGMLSGALAATLALAGCNAAPQQTQPTTETQGQGDQVANASDMAEPVQLDTSGLAPVAASELANGTYDIDVECSSSMFRIDSCKLTVQDGTMTARMTMGGKGYLYVYPGTASQAAQAGESERIPFEEENGAHVFAIAVPALNEPVPCAAFSKKKEMWYDRDLLFRADSLPDEAFVNGRGAQPDSQGKTVQELGLADGTYTASVTLEGGSGKASIEQPAIVTVRNGAAVARITWSSPSYDYMVVDGTKIEPVNEGGNSCFEMPLSKFDEKLDVIADTTAMSKPHEIEYTLRFDSASLAATDA